MPRTTRSGKKYEQSKENEIEELSKVEKTKNPNAAKQGDDFTSAQNIQVFKQTIQTHLDKIRVCKDQLFALQNLKLSMIELNDNNENETKMIDSIIHHTTEKQLKCLCNLFAFIEKEYKNKYIATNPSFCNAKFLTVVINKIHEIENTFETDYRFSDHQITPLIQEVIIIMKSAEKVIASLL